MIRDNYKVLLLQRVIFCKNPIVCESATIIICAINITLQITEHTLALHGPTVGNIPVQASLLCLLFCARHFQHLPIMKYGSGSDASHFQQHVQ